MFHPLFLDLLLFLLLLSLRQACVRVCGHMSSLRKILKGA